MSNSVFSGFLKDEKLMTEKPEGQDTQDSVQSANFQYYCNRCGCIQTPDAMHPKYHCVGMIGKKACNGVGKNMELMYPEIEGEDTVNDYGYGFSKAFEVEDDGRLGSLTDEDEITPLGFEIERQLIGILKKCVKYADSWKRNGTGCRCQKCIFMKAHRGVDRKVKEGVFYDEDDPRIAKIEKQYLPAFIMALGEENHIGSQRFLDTEDIIHHQKNSTMYKARPILVHIYDERDNKIEEERVIAQSNSNESQHKEFMTRMHVAQGGKARDLVTPKTAYWYRFWMKRNSNVIEESFRNISTDVLPENMSEKIAKKFTWDLKCANGDDGKIRNAVIKHVLPTLIEKEVVKSNSIPAEITIIDDPQIAMIRRFITTYEERRAKWI